MKHFISLFSIVLVFLIASCSKKSLEEKGFQVSSDSDNSQIEQSDSSKTDSVSFETRPSTVLLTGVSNVRITTIFKVNVNEKNKTTFIGSNAYYYNDEDDNPGNNWNNHIMPGFEAVYGYNLVNVSHFNVKENKQALFFETPVLIKTLYYPTLLKDTLNRKPISRNYFIVTAYNNDSNKDGFINQKDLRRIYLFNINGELQKNLIPENYSVLKSEYDPENDFMYVFAKIDSNNNGNRDESEQTHIFWIDLKDPNKSGQLY